MVTAMVMTGDYVHVEQFDTFEDDFGQSTMKKDLVCEVIPIPRHKK